MRSLLAILIAAALLLWPAALNHYPLMFGDSAVYLGDGLHLHVSWPRPLFYGLFERPLHLRITLWPIVVAQALIAAVVLHLAIVTLVPGLSPWTLVPVTLVLTVVTSLPWFVSQLMPDVFAGLLVLALGLVLLAPERLAFWLKALLVLFAAGCITMHLAFLPIALAEIVVLLLARLWLGPPVRFPDLLRAAVPPVFAVVAAIAVNAVLIGQASPSPYGKLFLLSRVLLDGPGQRTLLRECPRPDWTLCQFKDAIPPTPETIQFGESGLLARAGGYRAVAPQVWPIVLASIQAEPTTMAVNSVRNVLVQFLAFRTGDGLIVPMPDIDQFLREEFPPAEVDRYEASAQFQLHHLVPDWLQATHLGFASAAMLVLAVGTIVALRRRETLGGLYAAICVTLVVNAVVSGALSGVYDRYQSRFIWLAPFAALLMLLDWWRQSQGRAPA